MSAADGPGAPPASAAWLVVVDMQEVFAEPGGPWAAPGAADLVAPIARLAAHLGGRVVLTRFVAPDHPRGSWVPYYDASPWARRPPAARLWDLLPGLPAGPVVTATTFSKWGPELAAATGGGELVVCGVATDCCVLATAVAAADAGATVRVVGDACAAGDPAAHHRALTVLDAFAPMIRVTSVARELATAGPSPRPGPPPAPAAGSAEPVGG